MEEVTTHTGILAWKIPWAEEPGRSRPWGHIESDPTERAHTCKFNKARKASKSVE